MERDDWYVEMRGDTLGNRRSILTYETSNPGTAEKIETFFKELMRGRNMERLIDSDKFLQDMADLYRQAGWDPREVHFSLVDLQMNIFMEDTIPIPQREPDMVPVIRCKDCKHYKKEIKCVGGHYNGCDWWIDEGCESPVDEDDYCSYAERKEE